MTKLLPLCIVLVAASTSVSAQTYTVLHNFGSVAGDPTGPRYSGVISQSRGGNMFSSADDHWTDDNGTAFRISPEGTLKVVHRFGPPGAVRPVGGLTLGTDGQYYGTNEAGGIYGHGNVFKMKQGGGLTVLHPFDGNSGCSTPEAPPIESVKGDFYGTAIGDNNDNTSHGCIYRVTKSGEFTVLHSFSGSDGAQPYAPVVQGSNFYLYGTTFSGGTHGYGTIFRISTKGDFKVIFNFDGTHGANPYAGLIEASDGNFYGTATAGGLYGGGTAYQLTTGQTVMVLHNFSGGSDGSNEVGGLVEATDGNFYGTNNVGGRYGWGVLYRVTKTGDITVLHAFDWNTGASPQDTLLQHTNGILYGTTAVGGVKNNGRGTFYSFDLGLLPFVTYLPVYGLPGAVVQILGQGFTDASEVFFNGTPATYKLVYPTYIRAAVPEGTTSGPITVTTANGTLTSNHVFIVHP